ncbi:MAG: hypothetical protein Q9209_001961, partial [Squamulea sp. 1 TL-2023]
TVGRGTGKANDDSRGVDILLAAPGSRNMRKLDANHAFFTLHKRSGAWQLRALAQMKIADRTVMANELTTLYQRDILIEINKME